MEIREALTFDDVTLVPAKSNILPKDTNINSNLTKKINLNTPLISSAMDTVTESKMAIAMAQLGGVGVIHRNMDISSQCEDVKKVKRFESGMVINPVTIKDNTVLSDALDIMKNFNISGIPVINNKDNTLVGIITNRDVRFATDKNQPVNELMTKQPLIVAKDGVNIEEAKKLLHKNRIEKLIITDIENKCIGLITVKDILKSQTFPHASKDEKGRLIVAAATTVGRHGMERSKALIESDVDVLVVDTAHGHSTRVIDNVRELKKISNTTQIIAGNVATAEAASDLIKVGADAVKVGIGPGSICTTRIVAGVGVPQLTAIMDVSKVCRNEGIPLIADGGIKTSGDVAKALVAGADTIMIGSLFSGTDESPGEIFYYQGRAYKSYRGMGSLSAMAKGSADRYFQEDVSETHKLIPEGIEGRVPYKGSVSTVVAQLVGGLKAAMGYTGSKDLLDLKTNTSFCKITSSGLKESHVHDVDITQESPNYPFSKS